MLLEAGKECTDLMDTALGRVKRRKMSQCKIALREMSTEEFEEVITARLNAANIEPSEGASEAVELINVISFLTHSVLCMFEQKRVKHYLLVTDNR